MLYDRLLALAIALNCQAELTFSDHFKPGTTRKNIDFVEIIKQDLRRNNDDYKEIALDKKIISSSIQSMTIANKTGIAKSNRGFRRNDQPYQDYDYEDTTTSLNKTISIKQVTTRGPKISNRTPKLNVVHIKRNQSRVSKYKGFFLPTLKTLSTTVKDLNKVTFNQLENIPKFVNKNKLKKIKQFMKKNEGLLKDFMSSKLQAQTQQPKLTEYSTVDRYPKFLKPGLLGRQNKKAQRTQNRNDGELPNPELLDMAPAKGGRIHKLRIKGRLCHRHVLVPEGPKYDSQGRWYLPAHELVARRAYNATRSPRLLLPCCCNCCKKSVLGCE